MTAMEAVIEEALKGAGVSINPSLGEMMAGWFSAMQKAIEKLNTTMTAVLVELQSQGKKK